MSYYSPRGARMSSGGGGTEAVEVKGFHAQRATTSRSG